MILNNSDLTSYSCTVLQSCYTTWKTWGIKKKNNRRIEPLSLTKKKKKSPEKRGKCREFYLKT